MLCASFVKPGIASAISRDVAQVFFASLFVGQLIEQTINFNAVIIGLVLALLFWFLSVLLAKE
ncbi:MAG: hypothetical protein G01um101417_259 [Parcubacteria group bacterium Gr01-1014_17]|nr:MAG: hypothetical protein G01um101417_259 [Parcubacteria group bacterium Gr01-1014_17]